MTPSHPPLSVERERQLVTLVQRGDRGAMGELLWAYHKRIYHTCLRMVGNASDAADLAQDTFMKAVQHVDSFEGGSRFSTWLFRIAVNVSISHLRKAKLRRSASLDQETGGEDENQASPLKTIIASDREPAAEQRVETSEQVERLLEVLETLDYNLRSVIVLRDLQGMDYQEIAEVLTVPVGTVKSRLFRARLALRQAVSEHRNPDDEATHE